MLSKYMCDSSFHLNHYLKENPSLAVGYLFCPGFSNCVPVADCISCKWYLSTGLDSGIISRQEYYSRWWCVLLTGNKSCLVVSLFCDVPKNLSKLGRNSDRRQIF